MADFPRRGGGIRLEPGVFGNSPGRLRILRCTHAVPQAFAGHYALHARCCGTAGILHPSLSATLKDLITNTADWLALPSTRSAPARVDDDYLGALVLAAADLEHCSSLLAPRAAVVSSLASAIDTLPPQWVYLDSQEPFARWLLLATLAEHWGAPTLASLMLTQLERIIRADSGNLRLRSMKAPTREYVALCWTRKGRIARTMGHLGDAVVWYQQAAALVSARVPRDALPQASLGLAALAMNRGNIPAVERQLRRLMRRSAALPSLYQIPAHHLMAVVNRRRREFIDALLHVWAAFDLLDGSDFRREQLVGTMADIALEAGDAEAAAQGFSIVLSSSVGPMVRAPALYGAVRARIQQLGAHPDHHSSAVTFVRRAREDAILAALAREVHTLQAMTLAPTESVLVFLASAEIAATRGALDAAEQALESAAMLADAVGLYDRQFHIEEVRTRVRSIAAPTLTALPEDTPPVISLDTGLSTRHPALDRLLQLR